MITLLFAMCSVEFEQVDTRHVVTQFVEKTTRNGRTIEDMWVEQCVAKKEAGL